MQLLEYDHYDRFSASQALSHRWLASGNPVTAPLTRAFKGVGAALDRAIGQVIDTQKFVSMRDSMSEAEIYNALNEHASEQEEPPRTASQTVAWWQERSVRVCSLVQANMAIYDRMHTATMIRLPLQAFTLCALAQHASCCNLQTHMQKDQKRPGGVLGKIFNPSSDGQRKGGRAGGNATQRAFQSGDGSVDFDAMRGSNGASSSADSGKARKNGAQPPKQKQRQRQQIEQKPLEGHQELEPALKKAANAGIFSMFDRLK